MTLPQIRIDPVRDSRWRSSEDLATMPFSSVFSDHMLVCECRDGVRTLVRLDEKWVPAHGQGGLYIRPCLFSIDESIRVKPADRFLFVVFTFPFGSYYAAPVDVVATDEYVRAFPGGTGDVKPAG